MSSPSTHQDSPKVPGRLVLYAYERDGEVFTPWSTEPLAPPLDSRRLTSEVIPVSASDEAIERLAKFEFDRLERESDLRVKDGPLPWERCEPGLRGELLSWAREALKSVAAIEQVGGGQG